MELYAVAHPDQSGFRLLAIYSGVCTAGIRPSGLGCTESYSLFGLDAFWGLFLSYFFEYRTGFPFSIVNEQYQLVGPANSMRFPDYINLNLGIEKRIRFLTRNWAVRLTILNITGHDNPSAVINNIDSPDFMKYLGAHKVSLSARLRLVG